MKRVMHWTVLALALWTGSGYAAQDEKILVYPATEVVYAEVEGVPRFGLWGVDLKYPAPTLLVFSTNIGTSLSDPYYLQCGNDLIKRGYLCISLDLPGHDSYKGPEAQTGLVAWREASDRGEDFVAPFVDQVRKVLDHLIEVGYTDTDRIAACGTSRGGFMALQAAAADPRIKAAAAFAPVTDLMALTEFQGAANIDFVASLSLLARADALAGRSLWMIIGDRDLRVNTDACVAFARQVTARSLAQEKPADVTLLVQPEPRGHTTPAGAPETAAAWIADRLK